MGFSRSNGTFIASLLWVAALFTAMNNIVASASFRDWLMSGLLLILGFILAFYPERLHGTTEVEEAEGETGDTQTRADVLAAAELKSEVTSGAGEKTYLAPAPTLEESNTIARTAANRLSTAEMEAVEAEIGHTESRSDALAASAVPAPEELHGAMDNISTENSTLEDSGELSGPPTDSISRSKPDDLMVIDGIGPKIARALNNAGINSFAKLAATNGDTLRAAIEAAGMRFAPSIDTWPQQAAYAAKGDWDSLKSYIQSLKSGKKKV